MHWSLRILCFIFCLNSLPASGAEPIRDEPHGFIFTPPEGFIPYTDPAQLASTWHSWAKMAMDGTTPSQILTISGLGGTITPGVKLNPEKVAQAAGIPVEITQESWRDVTINRIHGRNELAEGEVVLVEAAEIPLAKEAAMIRIQALEGGGLVPRLLLDQVLQSFQADKLSRSPDEIRSGAVGSVVGAAAGLGVAIFLLKKMKKAKTRAA